MMWVNDERTLVETPSREIWQRRVVTAEGSLIGYATRQIVEPGACAVRYLIVYHPPSGRRLLLPAGSICGAEAGTIVCSLTAEEANLLTDCPERLTRAVERLAHTRPGCRPYWEEEDPDPTSCDH